MATKSVVRTLLWRAGIVGACFVALFLLLNFVWAPSCGRFSCSYVPSWWPAASADSGRCPEAIAGAMTDANWAADRLETIAKKKETAGLFYDPDGVVHEFDSSQNDDSRQAFEVGRQIGVFDNRGPSFLVDHVEVKVAAAMRRGGVTAGVLVINKTDGPCGRNRDGSIDPASCLSVVPRLLPDGAKLVVWWPGEGGKPVNKDVPRRPAMTVGTEGQVRRSDLVHAVDYPLVVTGTFTVNGSEFRAHIADEDGLAAFLAAVTRSPATTSTVRMFLKPEGYQPPKPLPIELPPSALYFDVDQEHQVAAAGMLVSTTDGASYQWRTYGDAGVDDVILVQDPYNPDYTQFPQESFITVPQLRDTVYQWAFADTLPAPATTWQATSEWDVRWPVGSGYQP